MGTVALIVIGMAFCLVTKKEVYPFAPYTMYSSTYSADNEFIRVMFVDAEGEESEIQKFLIAPWDEARLTNVLGNLYSKKDSAWQQPMQDLLVDVYNIYEINKLVYHGKYKKEFEGLRVYLINWQTLEALREGVPGKKKLLAAYP